MEPEPAKPSQSRLKQFGSTALAFFAGIIFFQIIFLITDLIFSWSIWFRLVYYGFAYTVQTRGLITLVYRPKDFAGKFFADSDYFVGMTTGILLAVITVGYPVYFALFCRDLNTVRSNSFELPGGAAIFHWYDWYAYSYKVFTKIVLLDSLEISEIKLSNITPVSWAAKIATLVFCLISAYLLLEGLYAILRFARNPQGFGKGDE
jgi:hypothetical protein